MTSAVALADLHRHLDGSLRRSTVDELATAAGIAVPVELAFRAGIGLTAALERFAFTLSLLQSPAAVRRVAAEMCEDAAADRVTTLEIRFAPQLHRGAPIGAIVDAAVDGVGGRAGLILCALYGESPALVAELVEVARTRPGVVGLDLAGGPLSDHSWRMDDYAPAFARAADQGMGRTVHAGEGRPPAEIRIAIERLGAQRIGHGTTLLDDPAVADLVIEREIVIEACPTSNVHTGVIASVADHPIAAWIDRGVKVCVCSDNTLLSATTSRLEHERARTATGMDDAKLARAIATGHAAAFRRG